MPKFFVNCPPGTNIHMGTGFVATREENGRTVVECTEAQAKEVARCYDVTPIDKPKAKA